MIKKLLAYTLSATPFQTLHCRSKWVQKEIRKLRVFIGIEVLFCGRSALYVCSDGAQGRHNYV